MSDAFTTAEDLQQRSWSFVRVGAQEIRRIVTLRSSGTTGAAKRLFFTEHDLRRTVDFFRDGMAHICPPGGRCAILLGSRSPDGLGRLLEQGLRELGTEPLLLGMPETAEAGAAFLLREQPDTVIGLPAQLRRIALLTPDFRPGTVLVSGDWAAPCVKETIRRLWDTTVYEHYGMTESGLGFAVQCPIREGLHIREDELQVEIVEPETGEPLPAGAWGEIVFTTLRREAMPLRRYRTGDISRLLPGHCSCGKPGARLDAIRGRREELTKPISIYALDALLLARDELRDYDAALDGNTLTVLADGGEPEQLRALLAAALPGFQIRVLPGGVPFSSRKRGVVLRG